MKIVVNLTTECSKRVAFLTGHSGQLGSDLVFLPGSGFQISLESDQVSVHTRIPDSRRKSMQKALEKLFI